MQEHSRVIQVLQRTNALVVNTVSFNRYVNDMSLRRALHPVATSAEKSNSTGTQCCRAHEWALSSVKNDPPTWVSMTTDGLTGESRTADRGAC